MLPETTLEEGNTETSELALLQPHSLLVSLTDHYRSQAHLHFDPHKQKQTMQPQQCCPACWTKQSRFYQLRPVLRLLQTVCHCVQEGSITFFLRKAKVRSAAITAASPVFGVEVSQSTSYVAS